MSRIETLTLPSGLVVIIEPMSGVRSAAVTWLVPAGFATEPEDRQGLSAMLAELLLRGAGDIGSRAQADAFDAIGASRAASVGTRHVTVSGTMLGERVGNVLPMLADMIRRPRFDAESIEPVRDLALQSLESLADDPQERAMVACRARHHPVPINRSQYGTESGIRAITRDDLVRGWERRAKPGGSILAVAGAVDPARLRARIEDLLGDWKGAADEPTPGQPPERGYAHEQDDTNQVQIVMMADAPPEASDESILERLAVTVLSGGMASRLFTQVREKRGLCYSVSAGYASDRAFARLSAYVGTTPDKAQEALNVLMDELRLMYSPKAAVTPEEFARARIGMKASIVFAGESTAARAGALAGDHYRLGKARSLADLQARIDAVTLDQLEAYLATRSLGAITIQTLGPSPLKPPMA